MKCPYCNNLEDKVIDSRIGKDGEIIRRRRECLGCAKRFTTHEKIEDKLPLIVKKDGRREPYGREKMMEGMKKACQKRPISIEAIEKIADKIEQDIVSRGVKEIKGAELGEKVMHELHDLDDVAYVRFASVYRSFKDISDFMEEMKTLVKDKS